jgi:hypothetical protein
MRLPSIKRLESAFPGKGKIVRTLLESVAAVNAHPAAIARVAECYNPPTLLDKRLHAINAETEGCGVEYIAHKDDTFRSTYGLEYVNHGDTYVTTIIFDHWKHTWNLCSWGDIVEGREGKYV